MAAIRLSQLLPCLVALTLSFSVNAFIPFQNPPWGIDNYNMSMSTISMACNSSGWFNNTVAASFGILSYDWSNNKYNWARANPMNDEELMMQQIADTKALNPNNKVFNYINLVKALPWFSNIRSKLEDPQYSGFFLKFKPGGSFPNGSYYVPNCDTSFSPPLCSEFYHDQEQTPGLNPNSDGVCDTHCYCGSVPCGEYLFDWRNGTQLLDFIINDVILGPFGLGNSNISGFFIDDFWCSNIINGSGACTDPVQGPTEIDPHNQIDMGLTDQDVADITKGWLNGMTVVQQTIIDHGGYTWSLIPGQDNANAAPTMVDNANPQACGNLIRPSCSSSSAYQTTPLLFGIHPGNSTVPIPFIDQDIAAFLLMRGPFAYIGWGEWGLSWPAGSTWNSGKGVPIVRPIQMDTDYGRPINVCSETAPGSNIFQRIFTKSRIVLNCNTFTANITMVPTEEDTV